MSREEMGRQFMGGAGAGIAAARDAARKVFPVDFQATKMGGIDVEVYTPANMPPRNRRRVLMMFNSDPTGVILAAISRMQVVAVHYVPTTPKGSQDIVAVYKELLKTHKAGQIGWVGLSGGCQYAGNTAMWLPSQKLPFPGALGLLTCAGGRGGGDSRNTLDGLDVQLSGYTMMGATRGRAGEAPSQAKPGDPETEILNNQVPKAFPPSYVLAGTRDMCLSESVLLHRKLRNAGVVTDLNIFEGMWHGFNMEPGLPETREAAADLGAFLDRYLAT
jgi:acetyl esterase/lipase